LFYGYFRRRGLGEDRRHLVRGIGNRAVEPSLRVGFTRHAYASDWIWRSRSRAGSDTNTRTSQFEYSRNPWFEIGGQMEQGFQALMDRSRAPLDRKTIQTILGYKHRPQYRKRKGRSAGWEVVVERPT